jgi:hypothetical protein
LIDVEYACPPLIQLWVVRGVRASEAISKQVNVPEDYVTRYFLHLDAGSSSYSITIC